MILTGFIYGGMVCKPALTLAAMSKVMKVWTDNVDAVLRSVSEEVARSSAVQELVMASAFLVEGLSTWRRSH